MKPIYQELLNRLWEKAKIKKWGYGTLSKMIGVDRMTVYRWKNKSRFAGSKIVVDRIQEIINGE